MAEIKTVAGRIAKATPSGKMDKPQPSASQRSMLEADPDCPICGGIGYLRQDLPITDPGFGKLILCSCRERSRARQDQVRLYRLSNLDAFKDMTFESFKTTGRIGMGETQTHSLELAFNQSRQYAQNLSGWLLLTGGYGCGKTHLAAAVANFVVAFGVPTLFLTVPDLLDWLRYSYDSTETSFESRFEEIRSVRLLVLDDLGTQNATPWSEEKLYQIINHRYMLKLPTIITTNLDLIELDGRVRSRLQDSELVTSVKIAAPDYRNATSDSSIAGIGTLPLLSNHTFGNFSLRENEKLPADEQKSLERAFRVTQQYAEKPKGWLVLTGTYGCGKTHLAAAIGNFRAAEGDEPIFIVVPDLLDHLRSTFSPSSAITYDHLFEQIRTCRQLILDDLGTQTSTPWAKEKLFQLLNYRYEAKLPTVITTSAKPDEIDPRVQSRLSDSRISAAIAITAPTYRGGTTRSKLK
jgi:DNA replication protein DnaC